MKRIMALVMILGLVVGSVATAEAAKKKKGKKQQRKVEGSYSAPATGACFPSQTEAVGCVSIMTGVKEKFLTAKVEDQHGQPVVIRVSADLDGNSSTETTYGDFCGETTEPIQVDSGVELILWVGRADVAAAARCAPGIGTQGTISMVLSNKP